MVQGGKAGRISKPYGLQGEVLLMLNPLIVKHIKTGNPLFVDFDGQRVPYFLEKVDLRSDATAIVRFEFIESLEDARKLTSCEVFLDAKLESSAAGSGDDPEALVGYLASDSELGQLGKIDAYYPSPLNPVWSIDYQGREIFIPVNADWVLRTDHKRKEIHFSLPEGLTSL